MPTTEEYLASVGRMLLMAEPLLDTDVREAQHYMLLAMEDMMGAVESLVDRLDRDA